MRAVCNTLLFVYTTASTHARAWIVPLALMKEAREGQCARALLCSTRLLAERHGTVAADRIVDVGEVFF